MNWLHLDDVRPLSATEMASEDELEDAAPSAPGSEPLDLVHAAAQMLRDMKEQSAILETRTRAFAHRASEELKRARDCIQALDADCKRLDGLVEEFRDRLQGAEKALEGSEARIATLEAQLAASEQRACDSEDVLRLVEDTIRSEILQPMRSKSKVSAAA